MHKPVGCVSPRFVALSRADGARHQSRQANRQADVDRDGEKLHLSGKADAGCERGVAEPGNIENRKHFDDKDRHQSD